LDASAHPSDAPRAIDGRVRGPARRGRRPVPDPPARSRRRHAAFPRGASRPESRAHPRAHRSTATGKRVAHPAADPGRTVAIALSRLRRRGARPHDPTGTTSAIAAPSPSTI
jgi:hypothetical protein